MADQDLKDFIEKWASGKVDEVNLRLQEQTEKRVNEMWRKSQERIQAESDRVKDFINKSKIEVDKLIETHTVEIGKVLETSKADISRKLNTWLIASAVLVVTLIAAGFAVTTSNATRKANDQVIEFQNNLIARQGLVREMDKEISDGLNKIKKAKEDYAIAESQLRDVNARLAETEKNSHLLASSMKILCENCQGNNACRCKKLPILGQTPKLKHNSHDNSSKN